MAVLCCTLSGFGLSGCKRWLLGAVTLPPRLGFTGTLTLGLRSRQHYQVTPNTVLLSPVLLPPACIILVNLLNPNLRTVVLLCLLQSERKTIMHQIVCFAPSPTFLVFGQFFLFLNLPTATTHSSVFLFISDYVFNHCSANYANK